MRYKCNPMLSLVALVLLALILVFTCTGCTDQAEAAETPARFTREVHALPNASYACIITDNETGVEYLFIKSGYGGGLTKLEG